MEVKIIDTSYGKIEYSTYGKGEPVLFIHGGHSNSEELLAHKHIDSNKFTLITPSRPGYGNTPLGQNLSPIDSSKQIIELMDKLMINKFNVIGISAGGLTAIALTSLNPKRVLKFIMASSISKRWLNPNDKLYKKAKKLFSPKTEKYTWLLLRGFLKLFPKIMIKKIASELTAIKIKELDNEEINDVKNMLNEQRSKNGFVVDLDHDLEKNIIEQISSPTLIIHSKNDQAISKEHPLLAKDKIKNSKIIWIDNKWGHLIWVGKESKDIINNITTFLLN